MKAKLIRDLDDECREGMIVEILQYSFEYQDMSSGKKRSDYSFFRTPKGFRRAIANKDFQLIN